MSKLKKIRGGPRLHPGPLSQETGHYPQVLLMLCGAALCHGSFGRLLRFEGTRLVKSQRIPSPAPFSLRWTRPIQEGARTALSARYFGEMIETRGHGCPRSVHEIIESAVLWWRRGNFFGCGLAALFVSIFCPRSIAGDAPQPPTGWRIELVAQAPDIRHPSVVCVSPDDRVFVAEDPMDISTPHADAQEGRILCLQPDGRQTVFAEKLHAVFGMQYLEGRLYVLHNPQFSVFTDDHGAGKD